jgi:biopolymer transport protein ExbB/TolQ
MRKVFPTEFIFSLFSLLIAFIFVHALYVAVIRPNAKEFLAEEKAGMAVDPDYVRQNSYYVVVKDFEQEACFILMFWALAILGFKWRTSYRQQKQLEQDFIGLPEGAVISVSDTETISQRIRHLPEKMQEYLLPRVLLGALERFASTQNIQDASTEVQNLCDEESDRLESELSIIRYIAWAIPSIGFIGTVRGIGDALAQAHRAVEGDITGVTQSLGVAFNSTFIALVISIVLMFIIHQIQLTQERLVLDSKRYCGKWLISRLKSDS